MKTILLDDPVYGTKVVFNGKDEVKLTVAAPSFGIHSVSLDLDDVDRLLAVREHAVDPELDLEEFFRDAEHVFHAKRMARAFVVAAPGLAEIVYGE